MFLIVHLRPTLSDSVTPCGIKFNDKLAIVPAVAGVNEALVVSKNFFSPGGAVSFITGALVVTVLVFFFFETLPVARALFIITLFATLLL